jgi:hypothetical protein
MKLDIADTILAQLGGNRFIAMTGARNLAADEDSLTFRLPARFAKSGITHVRVTLTHADLYHMEFLKVRGTAAPVTVSEFAGVYNDQLRAIFTKQTGLETSL